MEDRFKFRVWDKSLNKMIEVVDINLWDECPSVYELVDVISASEDTGGYPHPVFKQYYLKQCELIQCTGLKDKNGKLIYEGDILSIKKEAGYDDCYFWINNIVYWDIKTLSWGIEPIIEEDWQTSYSEDFGLCEHYSIDMELVGNIYENKELLK